MNTADESVVIDDRGETTETDNARLPGPASSADADNGSARGRRSTTRQIFESTLMRAIFAGGLVGCFLLGLVIPEVSLKLRVTISEILRKLGDPSHLPSVIGGTAILTVFVLWFVPRWHVTGAQASTAEKRFELENEARRTLLQVVGGVLLFCGLWSSLKTLSLQQQTLSLQQETQELQREGQLSDRYTKAVEELGAFEPNGRMGANGNPKINLEVRLGGIYKLESIAKESPRDRVSIIRLLTAYVRESSRSNVPPNRTIDAKDYQIPVQTQRQLWAQNPNIIRNGKASMGLVLVARTSGMERLDIQSVMTVIGRLPLDRDYPEICYDLSRVSLRNVDLYGGNFSGLCFASSDLEGARLVSANLSDAQLTMADLRGALLQNANFHRADLTGVNFRGASLVGADFTGANLSAALLSGAVAQSDYAVSALPPRYVDFTNADLADADVTGVDFVSMNAHGLTQSQIDKTIGNKTTKLPADLKRPSSWK